MRRSQELTPDDWALITQAEQIIDDSLNQTDPLLDRIRAYRTEDYNNEIKEGKWAIMGCAAMIAAGIVISDPWSEPVDTISVAEQVGGYCIAYAGTFFSIPGFWTIADNMWHRRKFRKMSTPQKEMK